MEDIDRKFTIVAVKTKNNTVVTQRDSVLFLAKDKALLPTLHFYRTECEKLGVNYKQLHGIDLLINRVKGYQHNNPDVKIPDIDEGIENEYVNR